MLILDVHVNSWERLIVSEVVHPSCKRSRKFRVGWVDGSIHFISKECIISPKFFQKALVWLSNLDGELR